MCVCVFFAFFCIAFPTHCSTQSVWRVQKSAVSEENEAVLVPFVKLCSERRCRKRNTKGENIYTQTHTCTYEERPKEE